MSKPEIIRCLKRYTAREIYTTLLNPEPSYLPPSRPLPSTAPEESTWSARSAARTNDVCDTRSHSASERIGLEGRLMPKV
jgi:hypothetical protein